MRGLRFSSLNGLLLLPPSILSLSPSPSHPEADANRTSSASTVRFCRRICGIRSICSAGLRRRSRRRWFSCRLSSTSRPSLLVRGPYAF
ncbi:hypothetical protein CRG98_000510 [Punica granatum]|uniref:Secreted protein n=1 Tax=Punica granatum TaxID=22663 RepID=A0A2I0LEU8_PUNGR|nr:hypothetical protein CRG98_000510 [Punica granatum]